MLTKAAEGQGIPKDFAVQMARQTVTGSAALAARQTEMSAAKLRENVTSPGGTTEAALKILMGENGLEDLMGRAVMAAAKRSREL